MKYYSRKILEQYLKNTRLSKILDIMDEEPLDESINVRFCRDCPMFEANYWQESPSIVTGWCRRMSDYRTFDDEAPYYVYVNSNSFCNEDDIGEDDG